MFIGQIIKKKFIDTNLITILIVDPLAHGNRHILHKTWRWLAAMVISYDVLGYMSLNPSFTAAGEIFILICPAFEEVAYFQYG